MGYFECSSDARRIFFSFRDFACAGFLLLGRRTIRVWVRETLLRLAVRLRAIIQNFTLALGFAQAQIEDWSGQKISETAPRKDAASELIRDCSGGV